jgi:hypothetical protein
VSAQRKILTVKVVHETDAYGAFPEGSSSYLFPHYKLHVIGGDSNVAVAMTRVGVVRKAAP